MNPFIRVFRSTDVHYILKRRLHFGFWTTSQITPNVIITIITLRVLLFLTAFCFLRRKTKWLQGRFDEPDTESEDEWCRLFHPRLTESGNSNLQQVHAIDKASKRSNHRARTADVLSFTAVKGEEIGFTPGVSTEIQRLGEKKKKKTYWKGLLR